MRFATFNILNGRVPTDQHVSLDGLADSVKRLDADVLALQEVDRNQHRSDNADLTAVAAEAMGAEEHRFVAALAGSHGATGATWVAATGEEHPDSAAYGIAVLSRYPVSGWQVVRLPPVPVVVPMRFGGRLRPYWVRDEPRVAVVASVETPRGLVTVVNTHLSFIPWWNARQLRRVVASVLERSHPVVLMGDLNMGPERAVRVTGLRPAAAHATFPVHEPTEQLDHVLLGGDLTPSSSEAPALPISDHRALAVELD